MENITYFNGITQIDEHSKASGSSLKELTGKIAFCIAKSVFGMLLCLAMINLGYFAADIAGKEIVANLSLTDLAVKGTAAIVLASVLCLKSGTRGSLRGIFAYGSVAAVLTGALAYFVAA